MLEINVKITVVPGEDYTPTEAAVIQALSGTTAKAPAAAAESRAAEVPAVPAEEVKAAPAKKAPARAVKAAPAKPSTGPAVLEEDPAPAKAPAAEEEEAEEDLLGGGEPEVTYTVQEAVTRASAVVKEKDGRARIKVALAKASEAGEATYGKVGDMADDTAALGAFMTALEA